MASIFATGKAPVQSKEQRKVSRQAWKPSSSRLKMQKSGSAVVLFRSEARQAELAAKTEATKA